MKEAFAFVVALVLLAASLLPLALVGLTAYMILLNRPHWGWMLVAALLTCSMPSGKNNPRP